MLALDVAATRWVNGLSGMWHPLDLVLLAITWAGVPVIVLAVALQWWSRVDRRGERHVAIACGLSFLLGLFLNQVILLFVDRIRPYDAGADPSAHRAEHGFVLPFRSCDRGILDRSSPICFTGALERLCSSRSQDRSSPFRGSMWERIMSATFWAAC